jgi:Fic family protein
LEKATSDSSLEESLLSSQSAPNDYGGPSNDHQGSLNGFGGSNTLAESLSRLELNSLQLRIYLDSIDQRISRMEPRLEKVAPLAPEAANKKNEISDWLRWFAAIAIEAQYRTLAYVEFIIGKTKLLEGVKGRINDRQQKVLLRMLREGPEGLQGRMSAKKYSTIGGTPPATTTRDLSGLCGGGAPSLERES